MALPRREYFYLEEIAKRWLASELDIQYYIENGILEARILLRNVTVEFGCYETTANGDSYPVSCDIKPVNGLYSMCPEDCWTLFRKGKVTLNYLRSYNKDEYCRIKHENGIKVRLSDIVITDQACMHFEKENGICPAQVRHLANDNPDFKHSNNYSDISINGTKYRLGPVQAKVIQILYEAYLKGHPWVYGKEVLRSSNAETMRMVDLFKSQDNWRDLILSDGKGSYRLNIMPQ